MDNKTNCKYSLTTQRIMDSLNGKILHFFFRLHHNKKSLQISCKLFFFFFCFLYANKVFAGYVIEEDGITYATNGDYAKVSLCNEKATSAIVKPTITYKNKTYYVDDIENSAFDNCKLLEKLSISLSSKCSNPLSALIYNKKNIYFMNLLAGCTNLNYINLEGFSYYKSDNGVIYNKDFTSLVFAPRGIKTCSIRSTVKHIENFAFSNCYILTSITIPSSVLDIGIGAFGACKSLASIKLPSSITRIDRSAFSGCSSLDSIVLPEISSIESNTFSYCTKLSSISFPKSIKEIKEEAFRGCTSLKNIIIPAAITNLGYGCFEECSSLQSAIIKGDCKKLDNYIFRGCTSLTTLECPLSIEKIGRQTFSNCPLSEFPSLPNLKYIDDGAFYGCKYIEKAELLSIDTISSRAFEDCSKLESVVLPNKEVYYGYECFSGTNIKNIVIPYKVNYNRLFGSDVTKIKDSINIYTLGTPIYFKETSKVKIYHTNDVSSVGENYIPILSYEKKIKSIDFIDHKIPNCKIDSIVYNGKIIENQHVNNLPILDFDDLYIYLDILGNKYHTVTRIERPQPSVTIDKIESTETTVSVFGVRASEDESAKLTKIEWKNSQTKNGGNLVRKGFRPSEYISFRPILYYNNEKEGYAPHYYEGIYTNGVKSLLIKNITPTTAHFSTIENTCGDLVITKQEIEVEGHTYELGKKEIIIKGLDINKSYDLKYRIYYDYYADTDSDFPPKGTYSLSNESFHTPNVSLTTIEGSKNISNTTAVICAKTNLDAMETAAGFEWRRYDAPELVPSTKANCPIIDGIMMGSLKNLSTNTYYKFRPYYTAKNGTEYYGDWSAFGTADAYVYFDPTVRTYDVSNIGNNHATVKGYAIAGSDPIVEQGFEYWETSSESSSMKNILSETNKHIVRAEGQWMTANIDNLIEGRIYAIRAFVRTSKEVTYGETQTFTTTNTTGIGNVFGKNETMDLKIVSQSYNTIKINLSGMQDKGQYQLFNLNGLKVCYGTLDTSSAVQQIQTPNLSTGIYFLKVSDSKQSKVVRLIIR